MCRTGPPQAGCRGTRRYAGRVGGKRKAAGLRNYIESIEPELAQPMAVEPGQPAGRQLAVPGQANDGVHRRRGVLSRLAGRAPWLLESRLRERGAVFQAGPPWQSQAWWTATSSPARTQRPGRPPLSAQVGELEVRAQLGQVRSMSFAAHCNPDFMINSLACNARVAHAVIQQTWRTPLLPTSRERRRPRHRRSRRRGRARSQRRRRAPDRPQFHHPS